MYGWVTACGTGFSKDRASAPKLLQLQHFTCFMGGLTGSVGQCIVGADVSSQAACMAEDVALERDALRGQHTGGVRNGCAGYGVTGRNRKPQARGSRDAGRVTRWKRSRIRRVERRTPNPADPRFSPVSWIPGARIRPDVGDSCIRPGSPPGSPRAGINSRKASAGGGCAALGRIALACTRHDHGGG
jgi:hypothetical protein